LHLQIIRLRRGKLLAKLKRQLRFIKDRLMGLTIRQFVQ
jgi:hypothetical protein